MFWLLLSMSILLLLFVVIIFSRLTIIVNYHHYNDNDDLKIMFKIWFGLIKYKINVPLIKIDNDSPSIIVKSHSHMGKAPSGEGNHKVHQITKRDILANMQRTKEIVQKVFNLHVIAKKFFQKVSIKKLDWDSKIGIGDAAYTGIMTGVLWSVKGSIIGILSHYLRLKEMPRLSVTPHFQAAVVQTQLSCIFQFRIGYAILAGLKLIKFWRGGNPNFKTKSNISN